mgnify:CR=1 FL=1
MTVMILGFTGGFGLLMPGDLMVSIFGFSAGCFFQSHLPGTVAAMVWNHRAGGLGGQGVISDHMLTAP